MLQVCDCYRGDMLKVGEIVLTGVNWKVRRLVPATMAVIAIDRGRSYGYHSYMGDLAASFIGSDASSHVNALYRYESLPGARF